MRSPAIPALVPAGQEGPLANDTFVATRADLEESLRSGDRLVLEARANPTTAASSLAQAMDAWRRALTGDGPGVWVRGEDREGLASQAFPREAPDWARAYWSPTEAVAWRLAALAPEERAVWPERFEPLADEALAAAPWSEPHLVRIERDFAFTRAAALAALRLCDLELESARFHAAASFLGRAERHAAWASASDGLRAAFAARRAWLPGPAAPTPPADDRRWRSAQSWRLERRPGHLAPGERAPLGLGARPGMVFTSDGAVIVQTPRALVTLTMDGDGSPPAGAAKVEGLAQFTQEGSLFPLAPASTGGLPHLPLLAGRRLFLVVDRARPGSVQFDLPIPPRSNHLLALDRDFEGGFVAAWARASEGLRVGKGDWMPDGPEGQWEWQPGPVLVDGELWVLGRSLPPAAGSDAEAAPAEAFVELFAFDTVEGHQRHRMTLHKAADLAGRDPSSMAGGIPTSCMPLGLDAASGQVLVCSNQGLCGLFEAADGRGRLMLITRRRAPREAGWPGSARPAVQGSEAWFTPFDSDRAY
ncbi:MAG: hypothetical protein R3F17_00015, partial [Planctomycetota bacterium]